MSNVDSRSFTLTNVGFSYGATAQKAISGIDAVFPAGNFYAVIGASGSGKSTLLKLLAGIQQPSTGVVLYGDKKVTDITPKERSFGVVFQDCPLFPEKSVDAVVRFPLVNGRTPRVGLSVSELLDALRISELRLRRPSTLSGGERQRVALARALVWSPDVLMLDEPLSAVDHDLRPDLVRLVKRLQVEAKCTVFYVTHDQQDVFSAADSVIVLSAGALEQQATPRQIYLEPSTVSVGRLVGDGPLFLIRTTLKIIDVPGRAALEFEGCQLAVDVTGSVGGNEILGGDVLLGLRPEHLSIKITPAPCNFQAIVKANRFRGSRFLVELQSNESDLFVWSEEPCTVGESVRVSVVGHVPLFDRNYRRLIATCNIING